MAEDKTSSQGTEHSGFTGLVVEPVYNPPRARSGYVEDGLDPIRVSGATSEYGHKQLEAVLQILRPTPVPGFLPWKTLFPAVSPEGTTDQIPAERDPGYVRRRSQYGLERRPPDPPQQAVDWFFPA